MATRLACSIGTQTARDQPRRCHALIRTASITNDHAQRARPTVTGSSKAIPYRYKRRHDEQTVVVPAKRVMALVCSDLSTRYPQSGGGRGQPRRSSFGNLTTAFPKVLDHRFQCSSRIFQARQKPIEGTYAGRVGPFHAKGGDYFCKGARMAGTIAEDFINQARCIPVPPRECRIVSLDRPKNVQLTNSASQGGYGFLSFSDHAAPPSHNSGKQC